MRALLVLTLLLVACEPAYCQGDRRSDGVCCALGSEACGAVCLPPGEVCRDTAPRRDAAPTPPGDAGAGDAR